MTAVELWKSLPEATAIPNAAYVIDDIDTRIAELQKARNAAIELLAMDIATDWTEAEIKAANTDTNQIFGRALTLRRANIATAHSRHITNPGE